MPYEATDDPSEQPRNDAELIDALRLAEALDRVEAGRDSGLEAIEDPELTGLVRAATLLRGELRGAGDGHAYRSFRTRSRAAVLHALEAVPVAGAVEAARIVPFYRRPALRSIGVVRPIAAVAAAAAIAIAAIGGARWPASDGDAAGGASVATNLTPRSTAQELDQLASTLADIQARTQAGQSVPLPLLRALSEGTARFANLIEQTPKQVSTETVRTYIQAAQAGTTVLNTATVEQDAQGALAAAQRAARDGVVVATRYLDAPPATSPATPAVGPGAATPASAAPATPATPAAVAPATTSAEATASGGTAKPATAAPSTTAPSPPAPAAGGANDIVR